MIEIIARMYDTALPPFVAPANRRMDGRTDGRTLNAANEASVLMGALPNFNCRSRSAAERSTIYIDRGNANCRHAARS